MDNHQSRHLRMDVAWRRIARLLGAGLATYGLVLAGVAAAPSVPVEQQPLFTKQPVPPNLVLMFDDSQSMEWNFIPDREMLDARGVWGGGDSQAMHNAKHNSLYYDPTVVYEPPPRAYADDGSYPVPTGSMRGFANPFASMAYKDLTNYKEGSINYHHYENRILDDQPADSTETPGTCAGGYLPDGSQCVLDGVPPANQPVTKYCAGGWTPVGGTPPTSCERDVVIPADPFVEGSVGSVDHQSRVPWEMCPDSTWQRVGDDCVKKLAYNRPTETTYSCAAYPGYTPEGSRCRKRVQARAFKYALGPLGAQTWHFVAKTGQCANFAPADQANCVEENDTSGVAAPAFDADGNAVRAGQNVANWFSYYRTRLLMAKSNVMWAFSDVKSDFRVGFGSINNVNAAGIAGASTTKNAIKIANVNEFKDGAPGTQKAALWSWIASVPAAGPETPLQRALDAVGQYYETDQPWESVDPRNPPATTLFACRQSYTILTTDGFWNALDPATIPAVGNVDGTAGTTIHAPATPPVPYTYAPADPFQDGYDDTLADVAMKYWNRDLMPGVDNRVPTNSADPAFWQHMTSFTIGLGVAPVAADKVTPLAAQDLINWSRGGPAVTGFTGWEEPVNNQISTISDLLHAGINGHGGFYSASKPNEFRAALMAALAAAAARDGSGAPVASDSRKLETGSKIFNPEFKTEQWTGDLVAYEQTEVSPGKFELSSTATWRASASMPAPAARKIMTYVPGGAPGLVEFELANLSASQKAALGADPAEQAMIVDYLRGDGSEERQNGGALRDRATPLGDIGNSKPVYVGAPFPEQFLNRIFTGVGSYLPFATAKASRTPIVYVAANDGMVHGFRAADGVEVFAYLPDAVIGAGIEQLADPAYGQGSLPHQFFNDGQLTVADVYLSSAWHTVLVGTTGRGFARAVYALDITDPTNVTLLWERSAADGKADSPYIGQMTGKPIVAQTADGTWSVIMGNGYNSPKDEGALLRFDLATGNLKAHTLPGPITGNGLATPEVWLNSPGTGVATTAYAGDIQGNVWSFTWGADDGTKLFEAKRSGVAQPITGGMVGAIDPKTNNRWLFFGTGNALSIDDLADHSVQSWYGIIINAGSATYSASPALVKTQGRDVLRERKIVLETGGRRAFSDPLTASDVDPAHPGWFVDFESPTGPGGSYVQEGERMINTSQVVGGVLANTSMIPESLDLCNPGGRGFLMYLNAFSGANLNHNFVDLNGDGVIDSGDDAGTGPAGGVEISSTPNAPVFVDGYFVISKDDGTVEQFKTAPGAGGLNRVSWREMVNP